MTTSSEIRKLEADRRRVRLAELIDRHFEGKQAKFIALVDANQGEISALLKNKPFGAIKARTLEAKAGLITGSLESEPGSPFYEDGYQITDKNGAAKKQGKSGLNETSDVPHPLNIGQTHKFDKNVTPSPIGQRQIPVISYVQAGMMTEVFDPFALGEGLELITTDLDLSGRAFGLIIEGNSMAPEFNEGDKIIIDPSVAPRPGDYVVAKNGHEEATFKKYRPRGTDDSGNLVFELVPLNDDYPTLNSKRDHMHVIGVMVEHRKYRRR